MKGFNVAQWTKDMIDGLPNYSDGHPLIKEAMIYSLEAGGKRIRPQLLLGACDLFSDDFAEALKFSYAIEYIHTYSLVHDDLPAMDDDDFRRGKMATHKKYGEAMGILVGDALLNYGYEIMIASVLDSCKNPLIMTRKMAAMGEIGYAAGMGGMISGQVADILNPGSELLQYIHLNKTGKLIMAALKAGSIIGGASDFELEKIQEYGYAIGLGFQIKDDILDLVGTQETMGKPVGSDLKQDKTTYPSVYGLEGAKDQLQDLEKQARKALKAINKSTDFFETLTNQIFSF